MIPAVTVGPDQLSFAKADLVHSTYSIRRSYFFPAVRSIEAAASAGAPHLSMRSWSPTQRRTPSSVCTWNSKVPVAGGVIRPVHRTEKLSGSIDGSGEPVPHSKFTLGSTRVTFRLVKFGLS